MGKIDLNNAFKKSIFLLGAGASYGTGDNRTGCKMSKEMFNDLQNKLSNPSNHNLTEIEAETFRFLISTLHYQNSWRNLEQNSEFSYEPNIEELALIIRRIKNRENYLPYPLTGNWADKLYQLESSYNKEISLFETIEKKLKAEFVPSWLEIDSDALDYLSPLVNLMSFQELNDSMEFFTLNYDKTIEMFLDTHNVKPFSGFISGEWKGTRTKEVDSDFDKLNLTKLHGSLDWVRLFESGVVKERNSLKDEEQKDIDPMHDPYIVFGHGTKTFSFDPFFDMVINFREKLASRLYIFAIGYSFFDPYINNLLIESLNNNPYSKIVIINPSFGPNPEESVIDDDHFSLVSNIEEKETSSVLSDYIETIQKN